MTEPRRKLICLDFDGVLHSYTSGWKGARVIPDPPTDGAMLWLCEALGRYDVAIFSSRSHAWFGRRAMKHWLGSHLMLLAMNLHDSDGDISKYTRLCALVGHTLATSEPTALEECWSFARHVVRSIQWPAHKPPAHMTIDDRAVTFYGDWSQLPNDYIDTFKPWNK